MCPKRASLLRLILGSMSSRCAVSPYLLRGQTSGSQECVAIYVCLEQGSGFHTVQQHGQDTCLVEVKLGDKAEISLPPHSTELIHGRRCERYAAHYLRRAVSVGGDLAAKVNEFAHGVHCVSSSSEC